MPALREVAKAILASDWRGFLEVSRSHPLYELRMLHAMVLGGAKCQIEEKLTLIDAFLLHIDNWALCDGLCNRRLYPHTFRKGVLSRDKRPQEFRRIS